MLTIKNVYALPAPINTNAVRHMLVETDRPCVRCQWRR